jgi:para-aminobenzoate synthetase / 4-amino-4-deoxychorismate lyase
LTQPVRLLLAERKMAANNVFLRHKTTVRAEYDASWRQAESQGAFDTLFYDGDGYITEGGRSNVLLQIDDAWYTPALAQGVLPGVMRANLMQELGAQERALTLADLRGAQQVLVCNALRGALVVKLEA